MTIVEETIKLIEDFHAKHGTNKRIQITKNGIEIVDATPEEIFNFEILKSNLEELNNESTGTE
jgi:hypothetical protein